LRLVRLTPHAPLSAFFRSRKRSGVPPASFAAGVAHEEDALSDVRCPDARSRQIGSPECKTSDFQVSLNSGQPYNASLARNLLSKEDWNFRVLDEVEEGRP